MLLFFDVMFLDHTSL